MQLITNQQSFTRDRPKHSRRPVDVFKACPKCKGALLTIGIDVLCADCDWMSAEAYVDVGGMNDLLHATREHFGNTESESKPIIFTPKATRFEIEKEELCYENAK
jgi:hypothetical protein